jgi:polysaccharide pyruvyl transferase WcaK-like protein
MKNIGLVGYYNFGNYGDELFLKVFKEAFPDYNLSVMHTKQGAPYFKGSLARRVKEFDGIIIGGGDLVIPWAMSPLYWREEYLNKPVFIAGVGVPTWGGGNDDVIKQLRAFFQHTNVKYIQCRDQESADWIKKYLMPKIEVHYAPDLVCALDFKVNSESEEKIFGLVTRAHQKIDYSNIYSLCTRAVRQGYRIHHIVLSTGQTRIDDLKEVGNLDFPNRTIVNCDSIGDLTEELSKCSVVCSMKFHGCVVAYMLGIPVISLSKADKFRSFFRMVGKELFLCVANDASLDQRLLDPMYTVDINQVKNLRNKTMMSLLTLRKTLAETL